MSPKIAIRALLKGQKWKKKSLSILQATMNDQKYWKLGFQGEGKSFAFLNNFFFVKSKANTKVEMKIEKSVFVIFHALWKIDIYAFIFMKLLKLNHVMIVDMALQKGRYLKLLKNVFKSWGRENCGKSWKSWKLNKTTSEPRLESWEIKIRLQWLSTAFVVCFRFHNLVFLQLPCCWMMKEEMGRGRRRDWGKFKLFWGIWRYWEWQRMFFSVWSRLWCALAIVFCDAICYRKLCLCLFFVCLWIEEWWQWLVLLLFCAGEKTAQTTFNLSSTWDFSFFFGLKNAKFINVFNYFQKFEKIFGKFLNSSTQVEFSSFFSCFSHNSIHNVQVSIKQHEIIFVSLPAKFSFSWFSPIFLKCKNCWRKTKKFITNLFCKNWVFSWLREEKWKIRAHFKSTN